MLEGAKRKINLTMLISSSSYPKNIYNMPLVEVGVEIQIKFEFKFKLELKQKKKKKRKGKKERAQPTWAGFGQVVQLLSPWPKAGKAHSAGRQQKEKKEMG